MDPQYFISKIDESSNNAAFDEAKSWLVTGRSMWPDSLELEWAGINLCIVNSQVAQAALQINEFAQRHKQTAGQDENLDRILCRMVLKINEAAGGAKELALTSGIEVFNRAIELSKSLGDGLMECRLYVVCQQQFEETTGQCSRKLMSKLSNRSLSEDEIAELSREGICWSNALRSFASTASFKALANDDFNLVCSWVTEFLKNSIHSQSWHDGYQILRNIWAKLGYEVNLLDIKFDASAPWDMCEVCNQVGIILERIDDKSSKQHQIAMMLAALYFVKVSFEYGNTAFPDLSMTAALKQQSRDKVKLDPMVVLPWFLSNGAASQHVDEETSPTRKRKRAVQINGIIQFIEDEEQAEGPAKKIHGNGLASARTAHTMNKNGVASARFGQAKSALVIVVKMSQHVYGSDTGTWPDIFHAWGIDKDWLELIRADVLMSQGQFADFLDMKSASQDTGLLNLRWQLQRASALLALFFIDGGYSTESRTHCDEARKLLLRTLRALPVNDILRNCTTTSLVADELMGSQNSIDIALTQCSSEVVVSRALHMLFIAYEADLVTDRTNDSKISRFLVMCQHDWPCYIAPCQRSLQYISTCPEFYFETFFIYISEMEIIEEFMHYIKEGKVKLHLSEEAIQQSVSKRTSTRQEKTKGKGQWSQMVVKYVQESVDDRIAFASALTKFIEDEARRLCPES